MSVKKYLVFLVILAIGLGLEAEEENKILLLRLGDPSLKNKSMYISAHKIYSARQGREISFSQMIKEMDKYSLIYLGESHDNLAIHNIQLRIIQALFEKDRNLAIGLEMFPASSQEVLNKWSLGILIEEEFIREAKWYINWNFNFGFYAQIFKFAKENKIPIFGLNTSRSLIKKIRMKGWDALTEEEKKLIPKPDLSYKEHRALIRAIFESTPLPHQMKGRGLETAFEGLYRAQSAWDEVMAFNILQVFKRERKKVITLAGSGHLLYNLGLNRRAWKASHLPFRTLICVEIPKNQPKFTISRSLADFIWGLPAQEKPAFPAVGLRLKKVDGLNNLIVEAQPISGAAKQADFKKGDIILAVNGLSFFDINEFRMYLAQFKWGDEVKFRILRNGQEKEIILKFSPEEFN
ncbi:MAG: ChaN family lipoprotein [Candidatus Aminicenantales bacterium]